MQLIIDRSHILKAISHGQSVVERKNTIAILGNVLLQSNQGSLTLTTTNMDLSLVEHIPANVLNPGQTTVSATLLYDIVRKLPESAAIELTYLPETSQLVLKAGRSRFQMPCLPAEDFPQLNQETLPHQFTLPANRMKEIIDRARFAMATEEARFYLNGIHFHTMVDEGELTLRSVATDSHRLACLETSLANDIGDIPAIIIGRKTIMELRKLLDETSDAVTISLSANRVQFHFTNATLSSRLIDGAFPDYETAIPRQNDKHLLVNTKDFFAAVDRVATVAQDDLNAIKLNLNENMLTLSAMGQQAGSAVEELTVIYPYQDPLEIGFNAKYLLDMAGHINGEETELSLTDGDTAVILKGINDSSALYVLMPIRV
ncbi:MAG: DNA polymerase III subunit beta [Alphaproteobacteria bacterium]